MRDNSKRIAPTRRLAFIKMLFSSLCCRRWHGTITTLDRHEIVGRKRYAMPLHTMLVFTVDRLPAAKDVIESFWLTEDNTSLQVRTCTPSRNTENNVLSASHMLDRRGTASVAAVKLYVVTLHTMLSIRQGLCQKAHAPKQQHNYLHLKVIFRKSL